MKRVPATSEIANDAYRMVTGLQQRFVQGLERLAAACGSDQRFMPVEWFRDGGSHGGGIRFEASEGDLYGRGSVNVSQVHYDDMPEKRLGSANAISTIIHPVHPLAPSVHIHVSWTEMKAGDGYWRIMADLNPSNENGADRDRFLTALEQAAPALFEEGRAQGDRYFNIPVLGRTRGVAHFYLEHYNSGDAAADFALAKGVGEAAIDIYLAILEAALKDASEPTGEQRAVQLAYHTLYLFQVLTLDRGTTTGLMVHDQNDVGIMGSLPARVDRDLLASWVARMPAPQDELLKGIIAALPAENPASVDAGVKARLAAVVREHYRAHPEAMDMQASGDVTPPTVRNHS